MIYLRFPYEVEIEGYRRISKSAIKAIDLPFPWKKNGLLRLLQCRVIIKNAMLEN